MDGWTNWQVYTYGGLLFSLRKEVLTDITVWMNPKDTIVSEKCRSQETNTSWFHFHEVPRAVTCIETESGVVLVARGWGWGMGSGLIGVEFSFSKMEKALETGYTTRVYLPLLNCTPKWLRWYIICNVYMTTIYKQNKEKKKTKAIHNMYLSKTRVTALCLTQD